MFIHDSISILEQLLYCQTPEISRLSTAILCSYISNFGEDIIPSFFTNILQMIQNPDTTEAAFYTLEELSNSSLKIPKEILPVLLNFIDPSCKYHYNALLIFSNIIDDSINFIHQNVIPYILNSYQFYDVNSLSKSAMIALLTFIHFPDSVIGDFIANCLVLNLPTSDSINIIDDQVISIIFDNEDWIQPYQPILYALITKIEKQDDDISNYGICSMSQSILMSFFDKYPEIVRFAIFDSISKYQSLHNVNDGFVYRCLSIVITDQNIADQFIPIVLNEINNHSFSCGEAALCLSRYCQSHYDSNDIINKSITSILPLLGNTNPNIRHQSVIAIQNIIFGLDDSFQPSFEHLAFFIHLMKTPGLESDFAIFADLVATYLDFFSNFDDIDEKNPNSILFLFFNDSVEFFIRENESNPLFVSFANILSIFFTRIKKFDGFDSIFSNIINKILLFLTENENIQYNDVYIDDGYCDEKYYCLILLKSILAANQQIDDNQLAQINDKLIKIIHIPNQNQLIILQSFAVILVLYQLKIPIMQSDQLVSIYMEACTNYLSTKNRDIACIVAQILTLLINKLNFQQMQLFLKKCCFYIRLYGDKSSPVFLLGHQLYHILHENEQIIDDFIIESFEHSCFHCSCEDNI